MKNNITTLLAAAALSSCVSPPPRDIIGQQFNFIGVPVRNVVNEIPPDNVPMTVEQWGLFETLLAKQEWERRVDNYEQEVLQGPGW